MSGNTVESCDVREINVNTRIYHFESLTQFMANTTIVGAKAIHGQNPQVSLVSGIHYILMPHPSI